MPKPIIAVITLAGLFPALTGCAAYVNEARTIPEVMKLPAEEREALEIGALTLSDSSRVTFAPFDPGRLIGDVIRGGIDASGLSLPRTAVLSIERDAENRITSLTTGDSSRYRIVNRHESRSRILIWKGALERSFSLKDVSAIGVRKRDGLASFVKSYISTTLWLLPLGLVGLALFPSGIIF